MEKALTNTGKDPLDLYLEYIELEKSENTYKSYKGLLTKFRDACKDIPLRVDEKLEEYLARIADHYLMNEVSTISMRVWRNYRAIILSWFTWMHKRKMFSIHPKLYMTSKWRATPETVDYERERISNRKKTTLTKKEVKALLDYCKYYAPREYIIFLIGFNLALRTNDMINIQRKHLMKDHNGSPALWVYGKVEKQTGKPRYIQIDPPEIYEILIKYMNDNGLTHPDDYLLTQYLTTAKWKGVGTKKIGNRMYIYNQVVAITEEVLGRPVPPHYLRRSKVTTLIMDKVDLLEIGKLARLSIPTMLESYDTNGGDHNLGEHAIL